MNRLTVRSRRLRPLGPMAMVCAVLVALVIPALAQDIRIIRIATGPIDTTEFPFGGLVGNAISNPPGSRDCDRGGNCGVPGLIANTQSSEGAWANLQAVMRGDIDLALSQADVVNWAYYGIGDFDGQERMTRVRVLARLYPSTIHLLARKGAKISSIKDLPGKRVAVDGPGTGTRFTVKAVLAAYNIKWASLRTQQLDITKAAAALKDGKIDAMFLVSGAPVLALQDLSRTTSFDVIPLDGEAAIKLTHAFPFYSLGSIPANTYGQHPEVKTVDVGTVLISRDDLNTELGYGIAKAIWHERNRGLFEAGHPRGKLMDRLLAARTGGVPIQAGAARYYVASKIMDPQPGALTPEGSKQPPATQTKARANLPPDATQTAFNFIFR